MKTILTFSLKHQYSRWHGSSNHYPVPVSIVITPVASSQSKTIQTLGSSQGSSFVLGAMAWERGECAFHSMYTAHPMEIYWLAADFCLLNFPV